MQANTNPAVLQAESTSAWPGPSRTGADPGYTINPQTLIQLDFGLFQSLCRLGTSRERICSALNISYGDFDYLRELSGT